MSLTIDRLGLGALEGRHREQGRDHAEDHAEDDQQANAVENLFIARQFLAGHTNYILLATELFPNAQIIAYSPIDEHTSDRCRC